MQFFEVFQVECRKAGLTPHAVVKRLDISISSITSWKNGKQPGAKNLAKLTAFFGVSAGYLLGLEDAPAPDPPKPAADDGLVDLLAGLPPGDVAKVKAFIAGLTASRNSRKE